MILSKKILLVYALISLIVFIGIYFNIENLMRFPRLVLIPLIFFYYYINAVKVNFYIVIILFLNFISEFILAFNLSDQNIIIVMTPNFIAYIFFIFLGVKNIVKFKPTSLNFISLTVILAFVLYLFTAIIILFSSERDDFRTPFTIYGIVLAILSVISAYNINFRNRPHDLFYFFSVAGFVISDTFYVVDKYFYYTEITHVLNSGLQMITYYFMVRYILLRDEFEEIKLK